MTPRQARATLGSRSIRRRGTNGKNIPDRPLGNGGRIVFKFRNPRPTKRTVALGVRAKLREFRFESPLPRTFDSDGHSVVG